VLRLFQESNIERVLSVSRMRRFVLAYALLRTVELDDGDKAVQGDDNALPALTTVIWV